MKNTTVATRIKQENFDTDFSSEVTMSEKCISQFNRDEESWENYIERLEQYFVLHGTANDKKVSALLTFMGPKTYQLLKDLLSPRKRSEKNYQQIVEVLSKHLRPCLHSRVAFRSVAAQHVNACACEVYILALHNVCCCWLPTKLIQ